jgi:flavin reductase (DIM6/NTAB) family NADH-FMN oxidoreductase RutF
MSAGATNPAEAAEAAPAERAEAPDPAALKRALGSFVTGVTVVTVLDGGRQLQGLTANAFSSLSLDPPLVLVCIGYATRTYAAAVEGGGFAVHILGDDQADIARAFADRGLARGGICPWRINARGFPMLDRYHAALECRLHARFPGGDHAILIGRVEAVHAERLAPAPLVYYGKQMFALPRGGFSA